MGLSSPAGAASGSPSDSSPEPLLTRRELPWLAAIVLFTVVLRGAWVAFVNVDPNDGRIDDSVIYHNIAHLMALGSGYVDAFGRGPTAQWMPGYPVALAALYKPFGFHPELAKGLNIAFAASTVVLVYLTARRLFDRRAAYAGALILALFPGQVYFSTLVFTETMFAAFFMLVLLLALVWTVERTRSRWWQLLLVGLLAGVATMVRAEGIFLLVVLVVLWAVTVRPWREVARYSAIAVIGVTLAMTPWTVRNAIQFHEFIPLRTNAVDAVSRALDPDAEAPRIDRRSKVRSFSAGLRQQLSHPWEILPFAGGKLGRLFRNDSDGIRLIQNTRSQGDVEPLLSPEEEAAWRGVADGYYYATGVAAIIAAVIALRRRSRAYLPLILAALAWILVFAFFDPVPRYHFPLGPIIAIFAGAFVVLATETPLRRVWRLRVKA